MVISEMTGEQIRQAITATMKSLNTVGIRKDIGLTIAADHNTRRKIEMIEALNQLYAYKSGNGPFPTVVASKVFDPHEGTEKSNIYFIFKELKKGMPWEIRRDLLILPTALTFVMLDMAKRMFPSPAVYQATMVSEAFLNQWTLPKYHPELSEKEQAEKREYYMQKLAYHEERLNIAYEELSRYFAEIENPSQNQATMKIDETHRQTKRIAAKVCGREKQLSAFAKKRVLEIWTKYQEEPNARTKGRRTSYAGVFDYCKRTLMDLGVADANELEKVVRSQLASKRRRQK